MDTLTDASFEWTRVGGLTDLALHESALETARRSAATTAELVAHLAEIDRRELHLERGHSSLFAYCTDALGLSEPATSKRIQVARLVRRLPQVLPWLAEGRIHWSGLCVLAPRLREDNAPELLAQAAGKTRRAIEILVAERCRPEVAAPPTPPVGSPRPDPDLFTIATPPAPSAPARPEDPPGDVAAHGSLSVPAEPSARPSSAAPAAPDGGPASPPPAVTRGARVRRVVNLSPRALALLERARGLLAHAIPTGDDGEILERALERLIASEEKRRFGIGARPRRPPAPSDAASTPAATPTPATRAETPPPPPPPRPSLEPKRGAPRQRRPPGAAVRRAVFERDGGRCTYVSPSGQRCNSTHALQLDHIVLHCRRGASSVENLAPAVCRPQSVDCTAGSRRVGRAVPARSSPRAAARSVTSL